MVTITIEEKELIEGIIKQCKECFVGMIDEDNKPYVLPMNFGYKNGIIYLHSAPEGTSIRSLEKSPEVCITFSTPSVITHQNEEVACSYRVKGSSAMCKGEVVFVEDYDEKVKVLDVLMENYTDMPFKYSEPSVRNVKVWKVEIEEMTGRLFGVPYKESHKYNQ